MGGGVTGLAGGGGRRRWEWGRWELSRGSRV